MIDVLCIGHATWDITVWVSEYPAENSKCEIHDMLECSGGPAANAACLLASWGLKVAFLGATGSDHAGENIVKSLHRWGVQTRAVQAFAEWPTPVSIITVNQQNGSRTIVNRKASTEGRSELQFEFEEENPNPRLLFFDGHELTASLEAMERWPDTITVLDAGSLREGTRILAAKVRHLAASERFASQLLDLPNLKDRRNWPHAISALHELNGHPVVITLGERGLIAGVTGDWFHLAAFPTNPVDTTGAGDIFHGGFAHGILEQMELTAALRLASAAAALSVRARGSSASIPSLADARALLASAPELAATSGADMMFE